MQNFPPISYSASNFITSEVVVGLESPFAAAAADKWSRESSNSSVIKAKSSQVSRRNSKIERGGNKRVQAHQNQQLDSNCDDDDDEADTANSYTKEYNNNQYKWLFEKELSRSSDLSIRLLLGQELVFEKFIPCLDEVCAKACQTRSGIHFNVWDVDTNTQHIMVMTKWFAGYYSIEGSWKRDFVDRRELNIRDKIKVGLDQINSRFCFSAVRGRTQV